MAKLQLPFTDISSLCFYLFENFCQFSVTNKIMKSKIINNYWMKIINNAFTGQ